MPQDASPTLELHIPLVPTKGLDEGEYQFPWIDELDEAIEELESEGILETAQDSEEIDGHYVFFLGGADEDALTGSAERLAARDAVPAGAFAKVDGRRVELSEP